MVKTAKFIPLSGYLLCPECEVRITDSAGNQRAIYADSAKDGWEVARRDKQSCPHCHHVYFLPKNPFSEA